MIVFLAVGAAFLLTASTAGAAITITEGENTVTTPNFEWNFADGGGNVERVEGLKWSPESGGTLGANLAASGGGSGCGGPSEFWGQSYGNADGQGPAPVVAGGVGTWIPHGQRTVQLDSTVQTNCSGDEPAVPVRTRYTFFDGGPAANVVRMERRWSFASDQEPYSVQGIRAYVPRLPQSPYDQEIWPNGAGTLVTSSICNVCIQTDWSKAHPWVAINSSTSNSGMLILRDPGDASPASVTLDYDSSSGSNNTGVSLDRPLPNGWTAPLTETEYFCFYNATTWPVAERAADHLPAGCAPVVVPINATPPTVSAGAGDPQPGEGFSSTPGTWENATGSFTYQWSRCVGDSCEAIGSATGATYTATGADVGRSLKVTVGATAADGETDSASSNNAGTISGQVYAGKKGPGNPGLAGAPVQACKVSGGGCRSTTTGAGGAYLIQVPVSGEYQVSAFPPAGSSALPRQHEGVSTVKDEADTPEQDVELGVVGPPPPQVGFGGPGYRGNTGAGGVPVVHWQEPFVIEYEAPHGSEVEVIIEFPESPPEPFSPEPSPAPSPKDPEEDIFRFPVPPRYPDHGPADVTIKVKPPPPGSPSEDTFPIYIDPSGLVQTTDGAPLAGATVTLYRSDSKAGPFTVVPNGDAAMSPMNRRNPDVSEADGHFGWDVIAGFYKVRAEKSGCVGPGGAAFVESEVLTVPPPKLDLDLRLDCRQPLSDIQIVQPLKPLLRVLLSLPGSAGTVRVSKQGTFSVKSATISCPAGSVSPCTADIGVTGTAPPVKRKAGTSAKAKTLSLGSSTLSIAAGKSATLEGKLSGSGLKKLQALKTVKAKISISASVAGGAPEQRTLGATLVAPKKKPKR